MKGCAHGNEYEGAVGMKVGGEAPAIYKSYPGEKRQQ